MIKIGAFSGYTENALLDLTINQVPYVPTTANVYVALHTSAPLDDDSGSEVSVVGYARVLGNFTPASGGSVSNASDVAFAAAAASWGTITHFGIYDAPTNGNLLYWAQLATSKTVGINDVVTFKIGNLIISLD